MHTYYMHNAYMRSDKLAPHSLHSTAFCVLLVCCTPACLGFVVVVVVFVNALSVAPGKTATIGELLAVRDVYKLS